ncbi:hypothetical protein D3C72_1727120 [compost metagenome]
MDIHTLAKQQHGSGCKALPPLRGQCNLLANTARDAGIVIGPQIRLISRTMQADGQEVKVVIVCILATVDIEPIKMSPIYVSERIVGSRP